MRGFGCKRQAAANVEDVFVFHIKKIYLHFEQRVETGDSLQTPFVYTEHRSVEAAGAENEHFLTNQN